MGATQFGLRDGFGPCGIPCSQPTRCAVPHRQNPSEPRWVTSSSSRNMSAGTARWESRSVASPECYTFYIKIFLIFYKIKYIYIYYFFFVGLKLDWIFPAVRRWYGISSCPCLSSLPVAPTCTHRTLPIKFLPSQFPPVWEQHLCRGHTDPVFSTMYW